MGPKYINIEVSKSAATTGRAQGCVFFQKNAFFDFPRLRRLPGVLKAVFFLPKLHFLDFPSLRRLPGVLKAVFFSAKIALLGFSKPGAPIWAVMGPIAHCLDGVLGPYWGPYLPVFFNA